MTVVEDRPIISVNHCLPVLLLAKTITLPAARSLCDSWASCHNIWQKYYWESERSKDAIFCHLTWLVVLHYLAKLKT